MHIPPVWYLTAENSHRASRHLKLWLLRTVPYLLKNKKAWSY